MSLRDKVTADNCLQEVRGSPVLAAPDQSMKETKPGTATKEIAP